MCGANSSCCKSNFVSWFMPRFDCLFTDWPYSPVNVHLQIIGLVDNLINDRSDAIALRMTCQRFAQLIPSLQAFQPPPSIFASNYAMSSSTNMTTPSSSIARTPTTTQTSSNNTSDTEPEWEFAITADMTRRLSLLPTQAERPSLPHLPTEIHLEIFSYLDKIDSCCLGLATSRTYDIYRSIYGTKLPLNTRRSGPNNLERAWEVVGKQMCSHCGIYRCELYKHIESWMPERLEYCSMLQNFGPRGEGDREGCFRVKPSKPRRCGKHPVRTTSLHQDDAGASTAMAAFASAL